MHIFLDGKLILVLAVNNDIVLVERTLGIGDGLSRRREGYLPIAPLCEPDTGRHEGVGICVFGAPIRRAEAFLAWVISALAKKFLGVGVGYT